MLFKGSFKSSSHETSFNLLRLIFQCSLETSFLSILWTHQNTCNDLPFYKHFPNQATTPPQPFWHDRVAPLWKPFPFMSPLSLNPSTVSFTIPLLPLLPLSWNPHLGGQFCKSFNHSSAVGVTIVGKVEVWIWISQIKEGEIGFCIFGYFGCEEHEALWHCCGRGDTTRNDNGDWMEMDKIQLGKGMGMTLWWGGTTQVHVKGNKVVFLFNRKR